MVTRALNGQDGHGMRFVRCMRTRLPYMNEHTSYDRNSKSTTFYEGHIGVNGDYQKTIIGTDGNKFNTVGTYGIVGEAGFTVGSLRDNRFDQGAETRFDINVFGGNKCGASLDLTGKSAFAGNAYTRVCLTGNLHGEYDHYLTKFTTDNALSGAQPPQLSSIKAGANVGLEVDATIQRLKVDINAGPGFERNAAVIDGQEYTYQNGVINANLGVEYTPPMPEGSRCGIVLEASAGLQTPLNIGKNEQGQFQVTGVTDPSNVTPTFGAKLKLVF